MEHPNVTATSSEKNEIETFFYIIMAEIYYHDIGDYLSREEKLSRIRNNRSVRGMEWTVIMVLDALLAIVHKMTRRQF